MHITTGRKSIFRSLFVPLIIIMIVQAIVFYTAAMYGGIKDSLTNNAVDILTERMNARKNEIETVFNNRWTNLDDCISSIDNEYSAYEKQYGENPLTKGSEYQTRFLSECGDVLVYTLRHCQVNGIFLILNDSSEHQLALPKGGEQKYGLCIRDLDQESNYTGREDLLLERAPYSTIDSLGCMLDSWWEAKYSFTSEKQDDYYYSPLNTAWENPGSHSTDLAYFSNSHQISGSDQRVVSYSVPLISESGIPYAVLGVEITTKYLSAQMPGKELYEEDKGCYILTLHDKNTNEYEPVAFSGVLYSRCFGDTTSIKREGEDSDSFEIVGRDGTTLYTTQSELEIYNNNSPFESRQPVLLAMVEKNALFSYVVRIQTVLFVVATVSLLLGVAAITVVSRRFASPITALARRVRGMNDSGRDYQLDRLGITEIDQLVDSIEDLNRNVSRNSARSEFFSRMSHDMRTPMNAIISFSSPEMLDGVDESEKDNYLEKIHSSGVYLLGLINEVLDMTKIENNKIEAHPSAVPAAVLFDTPVDMIEKLAQKKHIQFTTDFKLPNELWIMADTQLLSQIVMNLLSNAVKFTNDGGSVNLTVDTVNDKLRILVSDTGIGMSEDFLKSLYTPFEQENDNHEGTGLGLTIAKRLVELMNGTIECKSRLDIGTEFTVTLPLVVAQKPTAQDLPSEFVSDKSALNGKRILVCEDNSINITIITLLLERVGVVPEIAENGEIGVQMFKDSAPGSYSAVLMDIRMPVMDGHEAARRIRALERSDSSVPIIAMTADAFDEDKESSIAAGMNEHLSKPVEPQKLYETLMKFIV